ncbi:hypothetical protein GCM10010168_66390 [Actinoplanes ianthinogenes]|uniref:DUF6194 domain-containing protein n=1 Tax=Actinoplanes ianthinogenes TaxID=122358 RepID=A0ABN6C984_9ACTN|nr:DUF6194 family protein [Actinoplanes ianthinogenes]BCJ41984.1 hypothetical protein Aiant_26410 [Actinoplanes ianthinogenes]GGR38456.1 hypothetical protein GCM10010168_66390 [Actinoplanes ianthinogenes]
MLRDLLTSRGAPRLLAVGEPTHGEPAFARLRNEIFQELVALGFRAIAVESDRVAALAVDDYIAGGPPIESGHSAADRELAEWMRDYNATAAEPLAFHGFDAPLEMMHAASPVPHLQQALAFLGDPDILADDPRWSDPAAQLDAAHSIGRTQTAADLRIRADDGLVRLHAAAPRRPGETRAWHRARLHCRTALALLRYHAVAADPAPAAVRTSRMLGVRDALMAENLLDIAALGPTLVFGHNRHLQRHPSRWTLAGMDLEWSSAGSIVSTLLGEHYAVVIGSLGESPALGLTEPAAATFEGRLTAASAAPTVVTDRKVLGDEPRVRADVTPEQGYFPLDAETVAHCDAILHLPQSAPSQVDALAERILRLPGVTQLIAGPGTGAPELSWGDRFFFAGEDRMRPFATIVVQNVPGFDERSGLDRPGVFRLNVELGRERFTTLFGYGPEQFPTHEPAIDFTAAGQWFPHPVYAAQGWGSMLNPDPDAVEPLLDHARARSAARRKR